MWHANPHLASCSCGGESDRVAGPERLGRRVILELGISPSAAVREPLGVLRHEIYVMETARHYRVAGLVVSLLRVPMDLRHLGAVGERLAVAGNACLVGLDHRGIAEDRLDCISILTNSDGLPILVSSEL